DDDEPARVRSDPSRIQLSNVQERACRLSDAHPDEAGRGPIQEALARCLDLQQPKDEHFKVTVAGRVHDYGLPAMHRSEQLRSSARPATPQIVKTDEGHLMRPDQSARLLLSPVLQVGRAVAKRAVSCELRLAGRREAVPLEDVVHVADRHPPTLQEEW